MAPFGIVEDAIDGLEKISTAVAPAPLAYNAMKFL
jgi:hypothetical protein